MVLKLVMFDVRVMVHLVSAVTFVMTEVTVNVNFIVKFVMFKATVTVN